MAETTRKGKGPDTPATPVRGTVLRALIERRKRLGLSQERVGARMGLKQTHVSRLESSNPRMATIERYAEAVGARLVVADAA